MTRYTLGPCSCGRNLAVNGVDIHLPTSRKASDLASAGELCRSGRTSSEAPALASALLVGDPRSLATPPHTSDAGGG